MKTKFYFLSFLFLTQIGIATAGFINKTLVHDGITRKYVIYVPNIYVTQNIKVPLLVGLHGNGDDAANFSQICMSSISDTANYIVVYPEALPDPLLTTNAWHSGAGALGIEVNNTVDDVGFINKVMDSVIKNYKIDTNRMYVFGFSFGGFMTNKMAASNANRFSAAACVSGLRGNYNTSIPAVPVPYLHFHGTSDPTITYTAAGSPFPYLGLTAENTTLFWANQNGCSLTPVIDTMPDLAADGLRFIRYTYNNATTHKNAILYKVVNGVHTWYGTPTNDISYCQTIWAFFRQYAKTSTIVPGTPTASFTASDTTVCIGNTLTFTSTSTASTGSLDSIRWTILGGTPSTATTTVVTPTFNTIGNYIITLKAYKSGNVSTATKSIRVKALPTVNANTGTTSVCVGATTTLSNSTPNGTWSTSNGAIATVTNGIVTGVAAGSANIYYSVTANGCTKAVATTVTVNALPTITGTLSVCVGATTTLTGSATPNATTPWTSATTSVATITTSGVVTGVAQGTSIITYKNTNGCTKTVTVTVNALPTITGTLSVCVGNTTTLTGSATPNATSPWTSVATSVATITTSGVVTGVAQGTSIITYKNTNGCTKTVTVTVNALPTVNANTGTTSVCVGATTTLSNSTPNGTWSTSNGSIATVSNGIVTGVAAGTANIYYSVTENGCTKAVATTVTVNALPTITGTLSVCVGATTTLTGSATPNATTPWTSATTSVATITTSGVVTGVAQGTSIITYKNTNGCTKTVTVTVNALPTVNANTGTTSVCVGATTTLSNSTPNGTWSTSNGSIATVSNGIVTGVAAGTANIYYSVTANGCTKAVATTVTVNALPTTPIITQRNDTLTCSVTGATYNWYRNGVFLISTNLPKYKITQSGTYTVEVVGANSCISIRSANFNAVLTGIKNNKLNIEYSITPNPSNGEFQIKITSKETKLYQLKMYNVNGQIVFSDEISIRTGENIKQINVNDVERGFYLISLISDEGVNTQSIIIQ